MIMSKTETIYKELSSLSYNEKLTILSKLISELSVVPNKKQKIDIYNIRGIGKDVWEGIDAQEYVNGERNSW